MITDSSLGHRQAWCFDARRFCIALLCLLHDSTLRQSGLAAPRGLMPVGPRGVELLYRLN
jgi:hypothetical protein